MGHRYAVVGAGMQGVAAAYDLAKFGNAAIVRLADVDLARAEAGVHRINRMLGSDVCRAERVDVKSDRSTKALLGESDVIVSALPYTLHEHVEDHAISMGKAVVDMGQDTDVLMDMMKRNDEARVSGAIVVTDCGLAPGLINSLAEDGVRSMKSPEYVRLYCGGLPLEPEPPLYYELVFSAEGLIGEYLDPVYVLREGKLASVEPLSEWEAVHIDELGLFEAVTTSGGAGAAPFFPASGLRSYEYKTLRFPGHFGAMRLFRDAGLWSSEPVQTSVGAVAPLEVFGKVLERNLKGSGLDFVIGKVVVGGKDDAGEVMELRVEFTHRFDRTTGFTAMEQLTGFCTAIAAIELVEGRVAPGIYPSFQVISGEVLRDGLSKRNVHIPAPVRVSDALPV